MSRLVTAGPEKSLVAWQAVWPAVWNGVKNYREVKKTTTQNTSRNFKTSDTPLHQPPSIHINTMFSQKRAVSVKEQQCGGKKNGQHREKRKKDEEKRWNGEGNIKRAEVRQYIADECYKIWEKGEIDIS